ncbi:MAG: carboxypeptidase-like regulatory domain-containing protein, partial [Flavobacteriales bacterium]
MKKEGRSSFRCKRRALIALPALCLCVSGLLAQTGTIRGFAYNKASEEPIIFTNVYLKGTTYGSSTDVNGFFTISKVKPGKYTLRVTYLGFDTLDVPLQVKAGQIITKKLYLSKSSVQMKTFEVSAEKQTLQTEVHMSVQKITPKEIKQIPTIGGQADIAQYLQVLPGVIFTGDQGGQLYIRGGSPIQNKLLLDGMVIYNPFHSIGLFSVFDTDILRNADIYTGGFGAEYGGRISSVMDLTTRDGNKKRMSGKVGLSPFGASTLIEGPLKKPASLGGSAGSFIFSAKNSFLEQSSRLLYTYIDTAGLPFNFLDLYGKASFTGSNGSKVNLFGFNFRDQVNYKAISDLKWNTYGGGANFLAIPSASEVYIQGNFAYSNYEISLSETDQPPRTSSIKGFNTGLSFTYFIRDDEIKYGLEADGFATDFQFFNETGRSISQQENTTEAAAFFKYKFNHKGLVIEPGFRLQYYASLNTASPEPRLGVKYNLTDNIRIKAAAGMYSQNLISANSDRDVVNLFYGFLSGPDNLQNTFVEQNGNVRDITHKLQKANHAIVGVETDLGNRFNMNVEGYYKQFTQLTNLNRNKIYDDNTSNYNKPDVLKKDFIVETGDAHGVDFVLKYDYKRLYFWAVYSLGFINRWDGIQEYPPIFDRRHNVNLLANYTFGQDL